MPNADYVRRTWADGYGMWHAACDPHADLKVLAVQAREAIVAELSQREGPNFDPDTVDVKYDGVGFGQVFFVEIDPREDSLEHS